jgi:hypothetical protein
MSEKTFKVDNAKERLLCYAAAILSSLLSNPNNSYSSAGLIKPSIDAAEELIKQVYDRELKN